MIRRLSLTISGALVCMAAALAPISFEQDFALVDPATGLQATYDNPATPANANIPLWVGLGSSAHRRLDDDEGVITAITDRGPNADFLDGKLFPLPGFTPTIYRLRMFADHYDLLETVPIVNKNGDGLNGLSNFAADHSYGPDGSLLPINPEGVDPEGIVRLKDGSYWLSEENGPSLLHVNHKGKVLVRVVPESVVANYDGAKYPISGALPAILSKRRSNRGFESLALADDEKSLFALMQSPLDNPKDDARKKGNNRLIEYSLLGGKTVGEWVYVEDPGTAFAPLTPGGQGDVGAKQGDVKVGELVTVAPGIMVVKEGVENVTKLYLIRLEGATNILGTDWDTRTGATESLEVQGNLPAVGITPVSKQLLFDSRTDAPALRNKIESVAYFGDGLFLLINDNDFGIGGNVPASKTQFTWIRIDPALLH